MSYKFLCCSDTHLALPPALDETEAIAWLHAGDVYDYGHCAKGSKGTRPQQLHEWLDNRKIPVFAVRGNHDCSFDTPFFDKCNHVGGNCFRLAPKLLIIGIGWSGGVYYDLPTKRDIEKVISDVQRQYVMKSESGDKTIFLTHYPPWLPKTYDYQGSREGWMFDEIRDLADEIKPLAIIQGHVHEIFGMKVVHHGLDYSSLIVSPGPCGGSLIIDKDTATFDFALQKVEEGKE